MNPTWIIQKKRDGEELSDQEIREFIAGLSNGAVADYQATAFLMAVFFQGMSPRETSSLTLAMANSGEKYDLSSIPGAKVDKHSTGGVGDKVSLILAPLAAACGLKVPMMSGRGLGHTGGTLDKLESIPGFRTGLNKDEFFKALAQVGCGMIGQSKTMAPADRKLYALRDVTATVECIPLITASILSKKAAAGVESLVLDVKVGNGAFMKKLPEARRLAQSLISVAKKMGMNCRALLTNMDQPLGYAVGHTIEVQECIEILRGQSRQNTSSADLRELTLILCAHMLVAAKRCRSVAEGRKLATQKLLDGSAWTAFREMVQFQGGDLTTVDHPERLALKPIGFVYKSPRRGYLNHFDTQNLGRLLIELGGGRRQASDTIDFSVGLVFHKKLGAALKAGEPLVSVHFDPTRKPSPDLKKWFDESITVSSARKTVPKLIFAQY